jgi:hypothetical protein
MKPHRAPECKSYQSGILDNGRTAVLEELGRSIPEVSVDDFIHKCLPAIDVDINLIVEKLHTDNILKDGMWKSFPIDPANIKKIEATVFKPFEGILNIIAEYILKGYNLHQTLEFVDNPSKAPFAERGNLTRPDGYGLLKDTLKKSIRVPENATKGKKPVRKADVPVSTSTRTSRKNTKRKHTTPKSPVVDDHWDDIAIPFEFKKTNTDADVADVSLHLNPPSARNGFTRA